MSNQCSLLLVGLLQTLVMTNLLAFTLDNLKSATNPPPISSAEVGYWRILSHPYLPPWSTFSRQTELLHEKGHTLIEIHPLVPSVPATDRAKTQGSYSSASYLHCSLGVSHLPHLTLHYGF